MTPTKDVAPYITGAAPLTTSMRSTSLRLTLSTAGLKAPPQGTPSTTSKNASNSFKPQSSTTALAGPLSAPGAISTPATGARASRSEVVPLARRSSPVTTVTDAGTSSAGSGIRVAVTSTYSLRPGAGDGEEDACGAWARARAAREKERGRSKNATGVAATFLRAGFEIEWVRPSPEIKTVEFIAKHKVTGHRIAVETKSRHRQGALNQGGSVSGPVKNLSKDMRRLFNDALSHNPGDMPFAVFLDTNVPDVHDPREMLTRLRSLIDKGPPSTRESPSPYSWCGLTNYAWHYDGEGAPQPGSSVLVVPNWAKHPIDDIRVVQAMQRELIAYGNIPPFD